MNCLETQAWLQLRMDGVNAPTTEALERHWAECATCRGQHAAAQRLLEGVKALPWPRPARGFAQTVTSKVLDDRRHRQAKVRRRVYVTMALAASVLFLLLVGYNWMPRQGPEGGQQKNTIVKVPDPKVEPAPNKRAPDQKPEPRNAITTLTARLADATRDHATVVLAATNLDAVETLPAVNALPPMDPGIRDAGQDVSDGVRAVTQNARRAFSFFARELPMPDLETKAN